MTAQCLAVGDVVTKNYYFSTTKHFYLDVLVSTRDLYQKKFVPVFFQFLP